MTERVADANGLLKNRGAAAPKPLDEGNKDELDPLGPECKAGNEELNKKGPLLLETPKLAKAAVVVGGVGWNADALSKTVGRGEDV